MSIIRALFGGSRRVQPEVADWKKAAEAFQGQLEQKRVKEDADRKEQLRLEEEEKKAQEVQKHRKWLEELQVTFHCYVCGQGATGYGITFRECDGRGGDYSGSECITDYNSPRDLDKCVRCGNWYCRNPECSHKGICRNCGKELARGEMIVRVR